MFVLDKLIIQSYNSIISLLIILKDRTGKVIMMKYQLVLRNKSGYTKPLFLKPELDIYEVAYWQARIIEAEKDIEPDESRRVSVTAQVVKE